jgi:hypothetical protein
VLAHRVGGPGPAAGRAQVGQAVPDRGRADIGALGVLAGDVGQGSEGLALIGGGQQRERPLDVAEVLQARRVVLQVQQNGVRDQRVGPLATSCNFVEPCGFPLVEGLRLGARPAFWK